MQIADLITQGGGWAVGVAVCWLVGTGKLRLSREVVALEKQLDDLTTNFKAATATLNDSQTKERDSLKASLQAAEQRIAEQGARVDRFLEQQAGRTT